MDISVFHSTSAFEFLGRRAVLTREVITPDGDVLSSGDEVLISGVGDCFTVTTSSGVIVEHVPAAYVDLVGSSFDWDHLMRGILEQEYSTSGTFRLELSSVLRQGVLGEDVLHTSFRDGWGQACTRLLSWRQANSDPHFELSERWQSVLLRCSHPDIEGEFVVSGWARRDGVSGVVEHSPGASVVSGCVVLGWRPDYA